MKKRYIGLLILLTSAFTVPLVAQDTTVTGNVTDESGEALPGVSVLIVGTSTGTVTDLDGNFNLAVNDASTAILEFSFVGFKTVRENIQGRTSFNIVLRQDILGLDEIVVIGSSVTSTRKELGNAISTVKSDELTKATPQSLFNGLQGKIAGAQITQNSGDPAGGFSVRLRGPSTISGSSEPLYIIDGVVLDNSTTNVTNTSIDERDAQVGQNRMADINPNDIERLEVINGAAAAAIYGSRASNGVILITTKKGEAGAPQYSFSSSFNINELRKEVPTNRFPVIIGSPEQRLFPLLNPLSNEEFPVTRYDYQDQIFDTGFGTDNYLSARGGTENTTYFTSLAYMRNEGIIKNTDFRRISAKLSLTQRLRDDLKINFGINYINSFSNEKPDGNVFYSPINSINITNNIYNIEERDQFGNLLAVEPTRINPLTIIEEYDITQETNRVIGNFQATYTPVAGLTIDYLFGLDSYNQEGNTYLAPVPYNGVNIAFFPDGYASVANANNFQLNSDINISYFKNLSNSITSNTTVGYNFQYSQGLFTLSQGRRLTPNVSNVAGANIILEPRRTDVRQRIWGWFVQETLGWDEKLFLTLAGRIDGSTVFSEDNRNNFYPKIGASYVISEEEFFQNSPLSNVLSTVKLRGSYGEAGNLTAISAFDRFTRYNPNSLQGATSVTLLRDQFGNEDIAVERQKEFEFGTDLSLLQGRLGLTFNYYAQEIDDLILNIELAASEGANSVLTNVGSMENQGIELVVNAVPLKTNDFEWSLWANYARNRNEVTRINFGTGDALTINNQAVAPIRIIEGEPLSVFFGSYFARDENGDELLSEEGYLQFERGNVDTGQPQRDSEGNPEGEVLERVVGDPNPDFTLGFGSDFRYKKLNFGVVFESVQGVDVWDADYRTRQGVGIGKLAEAELRGEVPKGYIQALYGVSEFRIRDGSFTKLREAYIRYSLGEVLGVFNNVNIAISGRNLFSIDDFTSFDPEVNSGGQSNVVRAVNFGTVPLPRTYTFTISANF